MKTKSKIPALRFKGFTDAWEQRKFSDIVVRLNKSSNNNQLPKVEFEDIIAGEGRLNKDISRKFDDRKGTLFEPDNILYGKLRPYLKNWLFSDFKGIALGDFWVFKSINSEPKFVYSLIQADNYQRVANDTSGTKMPRSDWKKVSSSNFSIPTSLEEQQKIGSFFKQLDDTIALHQRKCEQTKELKKTMLQKMFPKKGERIPEIRFPEFTDEWEEKKLGEMLTERNVQQVPKEDAPLVSFTVENGVTPKTDRYDREFLVRTGDKKYKYTTFDDILYNPANLKFGAIARNKFGDAVFSPIYVTLVADKEKVLPIFIERIVTNGNFIQESLRYQEGTVYERMSVKVPDFLSMKISIPSLPEQEAIGAYFQTLDQDIAQIEKKLADLKELKKTLLRQLFV